MTIRRPAALAAVLGLCGLVPGSGAQGQQQQQPTRIDVTHCYTGDLTVIENQGAFRANGLQIRGVTRANQPGGAFDNAATRCVGATATLGNTPLEGRGYCEWATSQADRILIRWTVEAGRGTGTIIGGTGQFQGASGDFSFQSIAPIQSLEPGVVRVCNRNTGELKRP
jgi:hypothetical protein